jgi:hypothetical protein
MATPHVAGAAGLLFAQNPARTNQQVRSLIETTADDLGPVGRDAHFGFGRLNVQRAVTGSPLPTPPPTGLFSTDQAASSYAHARKLVRDAAGTLHLAWHTAEGGQYRVVTASSADDGATWSAPQVVFSSAAETYSPSLVTDGSTSTRLRFQVRRAPVPDLLHPAAGDANLVDADRPARWQYYHAVRPALFSIRPTVGCTWRPKLTTRRSSTTAPAMTTGQLGTSAAGQRHHRAPPPPACHLHAHGNNVYIASRTVELAILLPNDPRLPPDVDPFPRRWRDLERSGLSRLLRERRGRRRAGRRRRSNLPGARARQHHLRHP